MNWIFAYGSLIWRPGFDHTQRVLASVAGFERRFCQASHDHRGTPDRPGRVVTMAPVENSLCTGMAYEVPSVHRDVILQALDKREQDGYARVTVSVNLLESGRQVRAVTWIASDANPSWRGDESIGDVAQIVATRQGPSGTNREYLYRLDEALRGFKIVDEHVAELAKRVRTLEARAAI